MSVIFLDDTYERQIAPFIEKQFAALQAYDRKRPEGHVYAFDEHSKRVAADMHHLAHAMGMDDEDCEALYQAALIHDTGKILLPVGIWDVEGKPDAGIRAQRRQHTKLGVEIVDEAFPYLAHPMLDLIRDLMNHHHETMDGMGYLRLMGDQLSQFARMICVCDAFDGWSTWRPHFGDRDISSDGVLHRMMYEKKGQFDPDILSTFAKMKNHAAIH